MTGPKAGIPQYQPEIIALTKKPYGNTFMINEITEVSFYKLLHVFFCKKPTTGLISYNFLTL